MPLPPRRICPGKFLAEETLWLTLACMLHALEISLPPGVDPATVDFRTFYPYNPSEVKHRKRTTRTQLKVLEETFKKETKPNAALRKQLASQLDMTPRGVQVRFYSQ